MARAPSLWKERDVTRLIRAAHKAGVELNRVSVDKNGKIIATFGTPEHGQASAKGHADENSWDEVMGNGTN